jgi:hypothetical protein
MTEEISAKDWKTFCDRLTEMERGQIVTIEVVSRDGLKRELGHALTLEGVALKKKDECNDAIYVNAADGFEHEILEPIHITLKHNPGGGFNPVAIDAETGITFLHFKPALKPTVLEGLSRP